MTVRPCVLVIEDDSRLARTIATELRLAGYEVREAATGKQALETASTERIDAVLLDLGLPDMNGLEVARSLRHQRNAAGGPAILAVTARTTLEDRIDGLYAGADDYICKPFSMLELRARLYAHLRVRRAGAETLEFGTLRIEPAEGRCRVGQQDANLSAREFQLLLVMARRPGRIFSQSELTELTYNGEEPDSNALEVRVSAIRRKLRDIGLDGLIRTVRGAGYTFRPPET
jgi:DNA-binding response OmpR family regulator